MEIGDKVQDDESKMFGAKLWLWGDLVGEVVDKGIKSYHLFRHSRLYEVPSVLVQYIIPSKWTNDIQIYELWIREGELKVVG